MTRKKRPLNATEHAGDVYCMYDPKTRRIRISCDVRWMGKFFNDGHPIEIPNYNKNSKLRRKWRDAINKEFKNMEKNNVWRVIKKTDVPENRRLLGAKWVFKVKKNGVFKATLVAQGFS